MRVRYLGHATVRIDLGDASILTDPLLSSRLGHLKRHAPPPTPDSHDGLTAILISHAHGDHLHTRSLAALPPSVPIIGPRELGRHLPKPMRARLTELSIGSTVEVSGVSIRATPSRHPRGRWPLSSAGPGPIGFEIEGAGRRVYFAGDTDLFPGMSHLAQSRSSRLDLAFLPIWGWGPTLGPGHLSPETAAQATAVLRPRMVIPIHWGTLYPAGLRGLSGARHLTRPPREFALRASELAPDVEVRIVEPTSSSLEIP